MKHLVKLAEVFEYTFMVEAENANEALDKAEELYADGDVQIDYRNFDHYDMSYLGEPTPAGEELYDLY